MVTPLKRKLHVHNARVPNAIQYSGVLFFLELRSNYAAIIVIEVIMSSRPVNGENIRSRRKKANQFCVKRDWWPEKAYNYKCSTFE